MAGAACCGKVNWRRVLEYTIVCLGFVWSSTLSHLGGVPTWGMPLSFASLLAGLYHQQSRRPAEPGARPGADRGLWLVCCFPYAIYSGGSRVLHGDNFRLVEIATCHTLILSLATVWYAPSSLRLMAAASGFSLLLTAWLTPYSLPNSLLASVVCSTVFCYTRDKLKLYAAPSFSDGELIAVVQAVSVFATSSAICFASTVRVSPAAQLLQGGLAALAVLAFLLFRFPRIRPQSAFQLTVVAAVSCIALLYPLLWWSLARTDPLRFVISFVFSSGRRVALVCLWAGLTIAAVAFTGFCNFDAALRNAGEAHPVAKREASSNGGSLVAVRKVFHMFVLVVFTTGACLDPELTYVASGSALGVFIVVEIVRVLRIKPVSDAIENAFCSFYDSKDQGPLVLSHIYLLLGCAAPFLLYPAAEYQSRAGVTLALLSGVTTVGVGDTVAAVVGSRAGHFKWPGTRKTLEGTLASAAAQLAWCTFFAPATADMWYVGKLAVALLLTSSLEATTEQIDNLAVPLFAFPLFLALMH